MKKIIFISTLLFPLTIFAHSGLDGYSHIVGGDCSIVNSDLSIVFSTKRYATQDVYVYKGLRKIGNSKYNLLASGKANFSRINFFPTNYNETLRIDFDENLQQILGRKILSIASRISQADPESYDMGFLSTPTDDSDDISVKCYLNYEQTDEDLAILDSRLTLSNHPSLCSIEYFEPIDKKWILGCTGSAVGDQQILTAGHCEEDFHYKKLRIKCGNDQQELVLKNWTNNPKYRNYNGHEIDHSQDISILETTNPIKAKIIKIEQNRDTIHNLTINQIGSCQHYGMGVRSNDIAGVLYSTPYSLPPKEFGGKSYAEYIFEHSEMIASDPTQFVRPGDSGGPIICKNYNGEEVVVGIHVLNSVSSTATYSAIITNGLDFLNDILKSN